MFEINKWIFYTILIEKNKVEAFKNNIKAFQSNP
jgi:hypothetical protein